MALMITVGLALLGFAALAGAGAGLATIVGMFVVVCLIASFFLKLAANWISKLDISFGKALGITAASCLVGIAISVVVGLIMPAPDPFSSSSNPANLINAVVSFFTTSLIYSSGLKVKYGSACLMALIVGLLTTIVVVILFFIIGLLFAGALFSL